MAATRTGASTDEWQAPTGNKAVGFLERQRRLLAVVVLFATPVSALYWWASDGQPLVRLLHASAIVFLLGLSAALAFTKAPAYRLFVVAHHVGTVVVVSAFAVVLLGSASGAGGLRSFDAVFYLSFLLMSILAFGIFEMRTAVRLSLVIVVASTVSVVVWASTTAPGERFADQIAAAAAYQVLLGMSVLMLYILARARFDRRSIEMQAEQMKSIAFRDDLTGLHNRRHLSEALDHRIAAAARRPEPFSILLFDIDHFKRLNDEFGHAFGDKILRHIAHVMRTVLRAEDAYGRWGGEEFLVIARERESGALALAERLRKAIERHAFPGGVYVTVSIGVAVGSPEFERDTVVNLADERMYRAKDAGRNRVVAS